MPRKKKQVIELRNYSLDADFPVLLLAGEQWHISDVPSGVLHFHDCLEIGRCESQSGYLGFQGDTRHFETGDVTVIAGDVPHTTWSDQGMASKWSWLHTDLPGILRPLFPVECIAGATWYERAVQGCCYILSRREYPSICGLVDSLIAEMIHKKAGYQINVRALFLSLCVELMRLNEEKPQTNIAIALSVAPALNYIKEHYMEEFPMEMLAGLCGMSLTHFRRAYRELFGIGPLEYLNRTRVLQACSLMRISDESILSISERVGFRSLSSFNRHFLAVTGQSPRTWRRTEGNDCGTKILKYSGWFAPRG